ncbi:CHD5-like protein-domain-containing protein [Emericellopsis atlantica]|uniref:CHD5-like protein-domain-containing protein n=1 Tax=Emericellopsis atlantica TaxID=2614577 RepID=A0A9P8CRZ6_9HYPO|nr:CHD5-like protein-domain-containing protein [Emericellopsis atlantica]KAG9256650.1 CHD5-like protein-domain-containing protein [Emericellopsis atlantica]
MPSVLVIVFLVEVTARLVNALGAAAINDFLWTAVNHLPISTSQAAAKQRKLQAEYLKVRSELNATSSQDQFAKWAKLRRQHDKLLEQLEATKKSMEASRSSFDRYLTGVRMLLTKAPQYIVPFWYAKEPMFWVPHGWFPYYAEWIISFPRAPLGSVSVASWQLACAGMIALLSDLITGIYGLLFAASKRKEEPLKSKVAASEKKEL